jgi:hypothetical protein
VPGGYATCHPLSQSYMRGLMQGWSGFTNLIESMSHRSWSYDNLHDLYLLMRVYVLESACYNEGGLIQLVGLTKLGCLTCLTGPALCHTLIALHSPA